MEKLPAWIPIYYTVQRPGDVIVTSGFHQGFSLGLNYSIAVNFCLDTQDLIRCLKASTCTEECKWGFPAMAMPWKMPIQSYIVPPLKCSNPIEDNRCEDEWRCNKSYRTHYREVHKLEDVVITAEVKYLYYCKY